MKGEADTGATGRVAFVVPMRNAAEYLSRSLPSIAEAAQSFGGADIVVVDNGSDDGSPEIVRELGLPRLTLLTMPGGHVGAVRNFGAETVVADIFAFVDADCVLPPDYLSAACSVLDRVGCDATGSRYALPEPAHWVERHWAALHPLQEDGYTNYINAGNFVIWSKAFAATGGFDEDLVSGEDAELCARMGALKMKIYESKSVRAIHLGNPKSLLDFFRKQLWHGAGALGTARASWFDRPLLLTLCHIALCGLAVLLLGATILSARTPSLAMGALPFVAPSAAVAYRLKKGGAIGSAGTGMLLYLIYLSARSVALGRLVKDGVASRA